MKRLKNNSLRHPPCTSRHTLLMQSDNPCHLPGIPFLLPHTNKLIGFGQVVIFLVINKAVQAYFYSAVAGYWIYLNTSWYQHAGHLATDISFDSIQHILFGSR